MAGDGDVPGVDGPIPDIVAIFPPEEGQLDLCEFPPIVCAQEDLQMLKSSSKEKEEEVNVVIDDEVDDQVVELLGTHANLGFALNEMDLPYVVFHIKNMNKYVRFELMVTDTQGRVYNISASNRQSAVRVKMHSCSLPIKLSRGWNRICLDLPNICKKAFNTEYNTTAGIRVFANCRIWRLFFQDKDYADDELPGHLRIVDN